MKTFKDKINKIAKEDQSRWIEKSKLRRANKVWLDKSAKIALKILRYIRANEITQKDLAEKLNVTPQNISKILKGQENLTIETISKFESVLGISLFEVPGFQVTFVFQGISKNKIPVYKENVPLSNSYEYLKLIKASTLAASQKNEYSKVI